MMLMFVEYLAPGVRLCKIAPTTRHGESVLAHRRRPRRRAAAGVLGHAQVVEHQAEVARQTLDGGGEGVAGLRLDDADGEAAQRGDVRGAVAGADGASVLVPVPVQGVMTAVFDRPVIAIQAQYASAVSGVRGMTGHPEDGLGRGLAGLLLHGVALDEKGLSDTGKIQIVVQAGGGPDRAALDAAMARGGRLAEVGLTVLLREEQAKIGVQVRLIIFDGEDVVGVVCEEVLGELALGEQGVGGEGLPGDVHRVEKRDHHPDLVGLLDLVAALYGQGADFSWV